MLSRFCKLCHRKFDSPVVNLRKYRISSILREEHDDDDIVPKNKDDIVQKKKDDRVPIITAKRNLFNFYRGKVYSKFETIPIASQGWHHSKSFGDYFTIHPLQNEEQEFEEPDPEQAMTLDDFGLHHKLIENLKDNNVHEPTEIQVKAIPKISEGHHSMLSAETGCGKTFAFLVPILNHILKWKTLKEYRERGPNRPFGLIITPSLELALQITKEAQKLVEGLDVDIKVLSGGRSRAKMINPSVRNVDLLIGTFGITSKMITNRIYKIDFIKHVVLDEAHALFHETFEEKLEILLRKINFHNGIINDDPNAAGGAQLTLVSATKPAEMPEYLNKILDIQSIANISTSNFLRVMVRQKFMRVAVPDKPMTLLKMVKPRTMKNQRVIVFSNDTSTSDWISLFFNEFNVRTISLNGDIPLVHRKGKYMAFQRGEFNVLSTTNAGARGLDAANVNLVVNYDLPIETADYIHRCGRTGRIGSSAVGKVINFISRPYEIELTQKIERAARRMRPIPIMNMVEENMKRKARKNSDILDKPSRKPRRTHKVKDRNKKKARKASM